MTSILHEKGLEFVRAANIGDFIDLADKVSIPSWPEFMMHDTVANTLWRPLHERYPDFQFALIETDASRWIAVGNSIPVYWSGALEELPDTGWDWALSAGVHATRKPNLLCALAIQILPDMRGKKLSALMVKIMTALGAHAGLEKLIAPIRPNKKSDYPLMEMTTYLNLKKNGERFDPWVRVHERLGGRFLKICPQAMRITGRVKDWETWTGLTFGSSGSQVVPHALVPIKIDIENDFGVYVEPNVWFVHESATKKK